MRYPNKYKQWEEKERDFLLKNYLTLTNSEIANKLGRTIDSIRKEINKQKLKRPRKCDIPKVYVKRGRKRKIKTIAESIQSGLAVVIKKQKEIKKRIEVKRKIASEAVWAADFTKNKEIPKERKLSNPIIVTVPTMRVAFSINRNLSEKEIKSKISAYKEKYASYDIKIKR